MTTENPAESIVSAVQLGRLYSMGDRQVIGVQRLDLEIAAGELVLIKGASGSGKSTLLALLAGLDRPTTGDLTVAGYNLPRATAAELTRFRRQVVGMVFQTFNLLPTLTVRENVCLPALLSGQEYARAGRRASMLLDWLQMRHRQRHYPNQLSGGEMQRTAIARALINDPALVLADEPTGNLDSRNGRAVIELLADLVQGRQRTVVIATHSDLADNVATRRLSLKDGEFCTPS